MKLMAALLLIALVPLMASAECNLGTSAPSSLGQNVLSGPTPLGVGRILYAPADADDPAYRAAIAAAAGAVVDYFDARAGVPTPQLLATYDCIYTWPNDAYAEQGVFGNRLADFVDNGGKVILGVFCTYTNGYSMGGGIMTSPYCPVASPEGNNHFTSSSYADDGRTCLHSSVTGYDCVFRDFLVTQGDGVVDGHYLDGEIALAYRPDKRVIYCNGGGGSSLGGHGDWPRIIANACSCDGSVPTDNETWGKLKAKYR
jgi:hypothetical protein